MSLPKDSSCTAVTVGDLNGDGRLDIAVGCAHALLTLFGNGNGNFGEANTVKSAPARAVTAGDWNGDSFPDLAAVNPSGDLYILLNNGTGMFFEGQTYQSSAFGGGSLEAVDLNGDGSLDLVNASESHNIAILYGNGNGTFEMPVVQVSYSGSNLGTALAGDFYNDGKTDLVAITETALCTIAGEGGKTFEQPLSAQIAGTGTSYAFSGAAADFNGDGLDDLVVFQISGSTADLVTAKNEGGGAFQINSGALTTVNVGYEMGFARTGDLNGDGIPDIVYASETGEIVTALASSSGEFPSSREVAQFPGWWKIS